MTGAASEVRLSDGSVVDVALFREDALAAAVEIVVTSSVQASKARTLPVPWVELRANDVLDRPYWWVAVQDGLQPFTCGACEKRRASNLDVLEEIERRALETAARLGSALPPMPPYHPVAHRCWRCGAEMVVFVWPGGGRHSARRPPAPLPRSVRARVTDGGGTYWANTCLACSTVQGDFHLARDNTDYAAVREVVEDPYGSIDGQ